jgi:hypothetical protein
MSKHIPDIIFEISEMNFTQIGWKFGHFGINSFWASWPKNRKFWSKFAFSSLKFWLVYPFVWVIRLQLIGI